MRTEPKRIAFTGPKAYAFLKREACIHNMCFKSEGKGGMLVGAAVGVPGIGVPWFAAPSVKGEGGVGEGTDDQLAERFPDRPVAHLLSDADRRLPSC